jgi:hypothetical protein
MNNQILSIQKNLLIIIFFSTFSIILMADNSGLEITLNEKEQAILNSFEQKNQAESLIKLLQTLEKLSEYPTEAIDELIGKNPNHQVINRVVKRLKQSRELSNNSIDPLTFDSHKDNISDSGNSKKIQLTPVFAVASSDNGITTGKVIFQHSSGTHIHAFEGRPFIVDGGQYQLHRVSAKKDAKGQFNISLKTPTSIRHYIWPR